MKINSVPTDQSELFQKINEICASINVAINEKELFKMSLSLTMEIFHANRGSIFILNEKSNELVLKIAQGMKTDEEESMVKRMGEGIVGQVAQRKEPIFVDDISKDKRFGNIKSRGSYQTPSFICTPIILKDQLVGVINISDKESGKKFTIEEMQLLDFLASQIAINYRRIQLYQKFKTIVKERKDLEHKLGKSDQEAQNLKKQIIVHEKLATIGKLAGGIAHEFNNPLDGVMRYTNLSLEHVQNDEVVRGYLMEIKHGLKRMANIVKSLLACSRNDVPDAVKVNFESSVEHAITTLQSEIYQKEVAITKEIDKDIPPVYDLGLERIIGNLLKNALDSMDRGGRIRIKAKHHGDVLTFDITDTGKGIPEENKRKIFEPFFTTKDIDKGCGLGLTIVGEIIKSYEGNIDVDSKAGEGTTFSVSLPLTNE